MKGTGAIKDNPGGKERESCKWKWAAKVIELRAERDGCDLLAAAQKYAEVAEERSAGGAKGIATFIADLAINVEKVEK